MSQRKEVAARVKTHQEVLGDILRMLVTLQKQVDDLRKRVEELHENAHG